MKPRDKNEKISHYNYKGTMFPTRTLALREPDDNGSGATYVLIGVEDMEIDYDGDDQELSQKFYWWVTEDEINLSARDLLHTLKLLYGEKSSLELVEHLPNLPEFFSGVAS